MKASVSIQIRRIYCPNDINSHSIVEKRRTLDNKMDKRIMFYSIFLMIGCLPSSIFGLEDDESGKINGGAILKIPKPEWLHLNNI